MPQTALLPLPKIAHKRQSYDIRTGRCRRAAKIAAQAVTEKPTFVEDADGHLIRQWKPEELNRYTHEDIKLALRRRQVVEAEDVMEHLPERAIGYCQTKGWLVKSAGGWYSVTRKAAAELDLPRTFADGRKIRFLDNGL